MNVLHIHSRTDLAAIDNADLIIVHVTGPDRGLALRQILDARKSFALDGIAEETHEQLAHLAKNAKKRHVNSCWLGSLRFFAVFAKIKEMLSGGTLGELNKISLIFNPQTFAPYQILDLIRWLSDNAQIPTEIQESDQPDLTLHLAAAQATLSAYLHLDHIGHNDSSHLDIIFSNGRSRSLDFSVDRQIELKYLLTVIQNQMPWTMLPQISE